MSSYACEPDKGSEPAAGWEWAIAAAKIADEVVVLTRANNAEAIAASSVPGNLRFEFFDLSRTWLWIKKRIPFGTQLYYLAWQLAVRRFVRRLHARYRFDLTHHVTFAVDYMPVGSIVAGVPHIWGPVGGATGLPWRMWRTQGVRGISREVLRECFSRSMRWCWGYRVARRSVLTIAQNRDVYDAFMRSAREIVIRPNVVVRPRERSVRRGSTRPTEVRTALFVGRLIPHKGLRLAIQAIAHPSAEKWRLAVVGAGPEREPCEALAHTLGVHHRIDFMGRVPQSEIADVMDNADVLLAPSMYEGSGFAVAEAVASGLPVVGTQRGGPVVMVPEGAGQLFPADRNLVDNLARGLSSTRDRHPPNPMWSPDSLVAFLGDVYAQAVE